MVATNVAFQITFVLEIHIALITFAERREKKSQETEHIDEKVKTSVKHLASEAAAWWQRGGGGYKCRVNSLCGRSRFF